MTQVKQFLLWQLRDFWSACRGITVNKVCVFLLGAQLASMISAVLRDGRDTLDLLSITIPVTVLVMSVSFAIEIQWDRFQREQERIMNTLKDTK